MPGYQEIGLLLASSLLFGCEQAPPDGASRAPADEQSAAAAAPSGPPALASYDPRPHASASPRAEANASTAPSSEPSSPHCPSNMVLVSGSYCPLVAHVCLERPRVVGGKGHKQCQRYAPAKCRGKRRPLRFCMDRFEWPNEKGSKPRTLTSWPEARKMCSALGKRLCTENEFNFACEGESLKAHVYGDVRDDNKCNIDRPYRQRTYNYKRWDACLANEACRREYERLDQRRPAGSMPQCVSDDGVYDLNGNANEWVMRENQRAPKRSGLKGGWWGPVRNRCRPMTTFHLEGDYGYEVGFRCCKDAASD